MRMQLSPCPTFLLAAATIVLAACASAGAAEAPAAAPPAPAEEKPAHYAEKRVTTTSEVIAVDPATRLITLREVGDQEPQTFEVSTEVRNLDKVKPGDFVKADQIESVSIRIIPPGEVVKESDDVSTIERSKPGEPLAGVAARKRSKTATVSSIFPGSKEFLTRDAKGKLTTWNVKDAKELESIRSGDRVQLTYTTALAMSVTPAPKPTTTTAPTTGAAAPTAAPAPPKTAPAPAPTPP